MKCLGALFDPVPPDLVSELFTPWEQFEIRLGAREKTFDQIKEGDIIATVNGYFKGDDLDMIDLRNEIIIEWKKRLSNPPPNPSQDFKRKWDESFKRNIRMKKDEPQLSQQLSSLSNYSTPRLYFMEELESDLKEWAEWAKHASNTEKKKIVLVVDGPVKTGKTTIMKEVIPHVITDLWHCNVQLSYFSVTQKNTTGERVQGLLEGIASNCEPLRLFIAENPKSPQEEWGIYATRTLRSLSNDVQWIFAIDEFQQLYTKMDSKDLGTMSDIIKGICMDEDSPCWFILGGSLQCALWHTYAIANQNGVSMNGRKVVLSVPSESSPEKITRLKQLLQIEDARITEEVVDKVVESLKAASHPVSVSVVTQCARSSIRFGNQQDSVKGYLKIQSDIYMRDYFDLPQCRDEDYINGLLTGFSQCSPGLANTSLYEVDGKWVLKDKAFYNHLKRYYSVEQKKFVFTQETFDWDTMFLFNIVTVISQRIESNLLVGIRLQQFYDKWDDLVSTIYPDPPAAPNNRKIDAIRDFKRGLRDHPSNHCYHWGKPQYRDTTDFHFNWRMTIRLMR
eukprot:TRINITY_DN6061_c0_g2_i9.p1 TRINITY_DN6061_c0_g2~~TRINITY_DN6061_c0_g2_i9.p1  ORF type:complete len:639 (+),score=87.36 TRINITY_DN6061_c0_g2_i9:231-1919(+)